MWMNNAKISTSTKKTLNAQQGLFKPFLPFLCVRFLSVLFLRFFQLWGQVILIINFVLILIIKKCHLSIPLGRQTSSPPIEWWWTRPGEKPFYKPSFCHCHHIVSQKCDYRHQLLGGPVVVEGEEPMTGLEVVARIAGQCWLEWVNIVEVEFLGFYDSDQDETFTPSP